MPTLRKVFYDTIPGRVYLEIWEDELGRYHREDGPAITTYDERGRLQREEWYYEGKHHRENGPAVISYESFYENITVVWKHKGTIHRIGGPAFISKDKLGRIIAARYYIYNKEYTKEDYINLFKDVADSQVEDLIDMMQGFE